MLHGLQRALKQIFAPFISQIPIAFDAQMQPEKRNCSVKDLIEDSQCKAPRMLRREKHYLEGQIVVAIVTPLPCVDFRAAILHQLASCVIQTSQVAATH